VIGDIKHIQKLNDWDSSQIAGYEVTLKDFSKLNETGEQVYNMVGINLNAKTIEETNPQIFDWLNLTNMNVNVILVLMTTVGVINMITALLILILERTTMIGILKALGAGNWMVRKIFLYNALFIIGKGLIWGNIFGIGICLIQKYTGIIALDPESYYVSSVPINLNLAYILALNFGTLIICLLVLILPSYVVTKISPVKAMRFS
jgi:lipoprotein-releasing system permease protein